MALARKAMPAQRLPGLLPPQDARETLEISIMQSLASELSGDLRDVFPRP